MKKILLVCAAVLSLALFYQAGDRAMLAIIGLVSAAGSYALSRSPDATKVHKLMLWITGVSGILGAIYCAFTPAIHAVVPFPFQYLVIVGFLASGLVPRLGFRLFYPAKAPTEIKS
ncbi:MAG: hypothetical protein PHE83_18595 [Opitutaceae bacterium]|nr:hypothetical protein [Opitutaceae bacterium]